MDLNTPPELNISNCVYCFLKPPVSMAMLRETSPGIPGTPSSPEWWANLEENYGRASRTPDEGGISMTASGLYRSLANQKVELGDGAQQTSLLPCDCTE